MADIELVFKIPEELYDIIINPQKLETMYHAGKICEAVRNGTPLPKGHGRLKDIDWIDDNCENHYSDTDGSWCYRWKDIDDAPTIIEADKESKNV